jgi:fatty-acyl-CoA synthase
MLGLMQNRPLLISGLLEYAALNHSRCEVVSRNADRSLHRYTYRAANQRSKQLAQALQRLGIRAGDRVATLATSHYRHFECFYGIAGLGAVCHTVNPRLFEDQLVYIFNHADDQALLFDIDLLPLVQKLAPQLRTVRHFIALSTADQCPPAAAPPLLAYESLLATESSDWNWPEFDENCASSLCYTSGTTGNPKGVLYSHRSTLLHALAAVAPDNFNLSSRDVLLPIAPMYHANAWSVPYCAALCGSKLVLPGKHLDPTSLCELINAEGVTFTAAVPTVWTMMLSYLEQTPGTTLAPLARCVIGGTALSQTIRDTFRDRHGVAVAHLWGMTETSPLGTAGMATAEVAALPAAEREQQLLKQGRIIYGVELKVIDKDGQPAPRDGKSFGSIWVRGPWIAASYLKSSDTNVLDSDGWFPTGDVGTVDAFGYMQITDRAKDVIKSGGEWISSIDIENLAQGHKSVALAAVVAVPHPNWEERPVLVVTAAPGCTPSSDELLAYLAPQLAKWWLPDAVVVIDQMPFTATGKILKSELRERFKGHLSKG